MMVPVWVGEHGLVGEAPQCSAIWATLSLCRLIACNHLPDQAIGWARARLLPNVGTGPSLWRCQGFSTAILGEVVARHGVQTSVLSMR